MVGQHAAHLAVDVYAGDLAEAQRLHEVVHGVHAQVVGQRVVVHIAGLDDAQVHVHRAQSVAMAAELVAAVTPHAGVVGHLAGLALAQLQRRQGHEGLVGGAWRIGTAQRPVEQGLFNGLVERPPAFNVNALNKEVGVKRGFADKSQHLAGARVQRHQGATAVAKHGLNELLQLDVYGQLDRVARGGRAAGQAAHRAATGRGFHLLHAGGAVQLLFIALLHAELANVVGASVIAFFVFVLDACFFLGIDAAYVAHHMAGQVAKGVIAKQPGLDVHARKAKTLRGKAGHLLVAELGAYGQRLKTLEFLAHALEAAPIARVDLHHLAQAVNGRLQVGHLGRCDLQRVGRIIGGQHHAVAVGDESSVGHHRHDGRAVVLGLLFKMCVPDDLQVHQARQQQAKAQQNHQSDHQHTAAKMRQLRLDVAQHSHASFKPACRKACSARSSSVARTSS